MSDHGPVVAGLRRAADLLEQHHSLPATGVTVFADGHLDMHVREDAAAYDVRRAAVDVLAAALKLQPEERPDGETYATVRHEVAHVWTQRT